MTEHYIYVDPQKLVEQPEQPKLEWRLKLGTGGRLILQCRPRISKGESPCTWSSVVYINKRGELGRYRNVNLPEHLALGATSFCILFENINELRNPADDV